MLEIIREITLDVSEENRFTAITAKLRVPEDDDPFGPSSKDS